MWFPNRSVTNEAVQSQKQARSLKFRVKKIRKCTIRVAKTKALISFAVTLEADLRLCFRIKCIYFTHISIGKLVTSILCC